MRRWSCSSLPRRERRRCAVSKPSGKPLTVLQPEPAAPTRVSGAGQTLGLVLLVAEGYAYLIGTIAVFGAVVAILAWGLLAREPVVGLLALFLGAPTVLLTGAALRSLVFSAPEPNGVRLTSAAAPAMIRMVE